LSDAHELWSGQVHDRNAALKVAREGRDATREREREHEQAATTAREGSDLADLSRDFSVSVETREEKPMKGVKASRALPDWAQRGINALPEGHELRKARDEGRIKYDVRSGKWKAYGVSELEVKPAVNGHFPAGFFVGTSRRAAERASQ